MQAFNTRPLNLSFETVPLKGRVVAGRNVLAIQAHRDYVNALNVTFRLDYTSGANATIINASSQCRVLDGFMQPSGQVPSSCLLLPPRGSLPLIAVFLLLFFFDISFA